MTTAHHHYLDLGGSGPEAHFYHANGFPIGVYQPLINQLQQLHLHALPMRPTWPNIGKPPRYHGWRLYVDDLINQIERHHTQPIIGIGHSLGASCTALAAIKRPDLFQALVLIEPITVPRWQAQLLRLAPRRLKAKHPLIKSTLNKRDRWHTPQQFVSDFAKLKPFRQIPTQHLSAFAEHAVRPIDNQFELVFRKEWEAANYSEVRDIMPQLTQLQLPTVAIRGKPSAFVTEHTWRQLQQPKRPWRFKQDFSYGHLLPLEAPEICADLIVDGLRELGQLQPQKNRA
ncbi:alpha/beta fold hydrolase [Ferrimonas senticii]|uniref:alpha/beta fold hydrolase n=1 Tax=Ferrimonas senticii TaxID=394566 RepID=UPI0004017ABA|nr:alpha/beta hydrolase [Ferrimonas senticii]